MGGRVENQWVFFAFDAKTLYNNGTFAADGVGIEHFSKMVDVEEIFKHRSSTAGVKSKLSQTFNNDLRQYMHEIYFYANNFEHTDTILNAFFNTWELLNQQKFPHHDLDPLDGWLGDGILYEKMGMLVKSLEPETTVNLGSYFMAMTNANAGSTWTRYPPTLIHDANTTHINSSMAQHKSYQRPPAETSWTCSFRYPTVWTPLTI